MTKIEPMPGGLTTSADLSWGEELKEELTKFEYEARAHQRTKLTIEIAVRPSNSDGSIVGTPFTAITTDISPGGIGFLHSSPVPDKFLAVTLTTNHRQATVLVEVVRCRSIGTFCEVGARFICLLDSSES